SRSHILDRKIGSEYGSAQSESGHALCCYRPRDNHCRSTANGPGSRRHSYTGWELVTPHAIARPVSLAFQSAPVDVSHLSSFFSILPNLPKECLVSNYRLLRLALLSGWYES